MAILFRPYLPVDQTHWIPLLSKELAAFDFRVWPDIGNPSEISYYIGWEVFEGDKTAYPNLKAFFSLRAGVERFIGNPNFPDNAKLIRMIDPGLTESIVEYILSFVLRFHREHDRMAEYIQGKWGSIIPKRAGKTTVGLMGLGHIGQSAAAKLNMLGFDIRGWSRSPKNIEGVQSFVDNAELENFLSGTNILVCILPLTPQTTGILNKELFSKLPQNAYVINIARGKHLVDDDLIAAISTNHIAGAALDVFHKEPLPRDHNFYNVPEIILTPHLAGITAPDTAVEVMRNALLDLEDGKNPKGLVDIKNGY